MAYLGEVPNPVNRGLTRKDTFTGDGSTVTFDLATAIPNVTENDIEVFVDNVRQEPGSGDAYTLGFDGSSNFKRITFTAAPEAAAEIYVLSGSAQTQLLSVADDSITTAKIQNGAITADKIADGTVIAADIADGAVTTAKLGADAVDGTKIADDAIDSEHITDGSVDNVHLANSSITINGTSIALGASGTIVAGTDWQTVVTADGSTATTASAGEGYFIDTTSAAHTVTLPSSPTQGDEVHIVDYAGTFGTNNVTIGRNGSNIDGSASNATLETNRLNVRFVYIDATKGWRAIFDDASESYGASYLSATGGTVTESGDYKIHTFTGDGCFVVSCAGSPAGSDSVEYIVVAGGASGGGGYYGAGGGAGGFRFASPSLAPLCYPGKPLAGSNVPVSATTYPVTVGGGGSGVSSMCVPGNAGSNSVFSTI